MKNKKPLKYPLKIRTKITIAYSIVLILSSILTFFAFNLINRYILQTELQKVSLQTLTAMDKNLEGIFAQIKDLSNLIFFDPNMQNSLNDVNSKDGNFRSQANITKSITNMLLSEEYIASVYLFDKYSYYYQSYRTGNYTTDIRDLTKAPWYQEVEEQQGNPILVLNSGGVLVKKNEPDMFISVIRNIISLATYEKLGTLIVNVDERKIQEYFSEVSKEYGSEFLIVDSSNKYVVSPRKYLEVVDYHFLQKPIENNSCSVIELNGQKYIIAEIKSALSDWKMMSVTPLVSSHLTNNFRNVLYIPIVIINFIFIFICTIYLTQLVFNPLDRMLHYMHFVEQGDFVNIPVEADREDEIIKLKRGFNQMVKAIQNLIEEIKKEQKIIRKNELDLIQAQVNPHFLYNTLDAASALNLIGDNEGAYEVVQQLGNFYRNSLGSGKEMITIKEELDCIRSYIAILNIRYDNKINLIIDVEEDILKFRILKLILQPIVENAVYHGIRYKHGRGTIKIQGYQDEQEIIFIVTDDGKGMNEDKVKQILDYKESSMAKGFGIYSAMQRIAIFYNIEKPITIISEPECGTEITIRVKIMEEC